MVTPLMLGSIGQISRSVKNIKQAEAWYGEVLGLPHLYTFGTLAFFDCGGVRLFLSQGESNEPWPVASGTCQFRESAAPRCFRPPLSFSDGSA